MKEGVRDAGKERTVRGKCNVSGRLGILLNVATQQRLLFCKELGHRILFDQTVGTYFYGEKRELVLLCNEV